MNKQIEEMTKIIWDNPNMYDLPSAEDVAFELYKAGYRKTADVAREIFEEIERVVSEKYNHFVFGNNDLDSLEQDAIINFSDEMSDCFAELKKKYESEGAE